MFDPGAPLRNAERVAEVASQLGFDVALVGAAALAAHGFTRGTKDVDLGATVSPNRQLRALDEALAASGLKTRLRLPDDDDPLGGVLSVWAHEGHDGEPVDVVEVVNFYNPGRPRRNPARDAIARAEPVEGLRLRCVTLPDLVALKLYAGGHSDLVDIVQLLAHNPDVDLAAVRAVAAPYDERQCLEPLIAEAARFRADAQRF